ncbi:MAG: hypothetical protein PHI97_19515 [Desulfobulbus sp.]|nr:hypothetical protein [Desulfobulbus sp.]
MIKLIFLIFIQALMLLLNGCHDKNTDSDGVPIVSDIQHLTDSKGNTMTTEEFLKMWCPGKNRTTISNRTCEKLQNQRNIERSIEKDAVKTIQKW